MAIRAGPTKIAQLGPLDLNYDSKALLGYRRAEIFRIYPVIL